MENLVAQLKKIHFQQDFHSRYNQNNAIDIETPSLLNVPLKDCFPQAMNEPCRKESFDNRLSPLLDLDEIDDGERESTGTNETDYESDERKEHDSGDNYSDVSSKMYSGIRSKLRQLPTRASKMKSRGLRTSMKPSKITKLRPSQIEKLYSCQTLKNFRHTNLETIFEEPQNVHGSTNSSTIGEDPQYRLIGSVKHKRFLKFCDGFHINKTLVKHRRAMIKKKFGRRHARKKLPLESFLHHLNYRHNSESEEEIKNKFEPEKPIGSNNNSILPLIIVTNAEQEVMEA